MAALSQLLRADIFKKKLVLNIFLLNYASTSITSLVVSSTTPLASSDTLTMTSDVSAPPVSPLRQHPTASRFERRPELSG
jgi:uncharacterized lipoprotein YajG